MPRCCQHPIHMVLGEPCFHTFAHSFLCCTAGQAYHGDACPETPSTIFFWTPLSSASEISSQWHPSARPQCRHVGGSEEFHNPMLNEVLSEVCTPIFPRHPWSTVGIADIFFEGILWRSPRPHNWVCDGKYIQGHTDRFVLVDPARPSFSQERCNLDRASQPHRHHMMGLLRHSSLTYLCTREKRRDLTGSKHGDIISSYRDHYRTTLKFRFARENQTE